MPRKANEWAALISCAEQQILLNNKPLEPKIKRYFIFILELYLFIIRKEIFYFDKWNEWLRLVHLS